LIRDLLGLKQEGWYPLYHLWRRDAPRFL